MVHPTVLNLLDIFLLGSILLFAFEALRVTYFRAQPLCATAFALITIGSFGWIVGDLYADKLPLYAILFHAGFAIHIFLLYRKQLNAARSPMRRSTDWKHQTFDSEAHRTGRSRFREQAKQGYQPHVPVPRPKGAE